MTLRDAAHVVLRSGMRRALAAFAATLTAVITSAACHRSEEPTPSPAEPAAPSSVSSSAHTKRPPLPAPAESSASVLPMASREPDWDLDPKNPAKDYVGRYLRASKRYGEKACVVVSAATFTGEKSVVETRNDPSGACGKPGDLRDRFFVTVSPDRMSVDESLHTPKLQAWPDGSDPGSPPARTADIQDLHAWRAVLRDTFHRLELAPLRVQLYGRGTYPIISVAGWHGKIERDMTPGQLEGAAKALCEANDGEPLAIFAGVDRATLLRITCPAGARFESLL